MDFEDFRKSLPGKAPPAGLTAPLEALWWDAKGDWNKAHEIAQAQEDAPSSWVHAYLHRVEGDLGNAGYWYRRAGHQPATGALKAEWEAMTKALLQGEG
jgi:hypothetical protein